MRKRVILENLRLEKLVHGGQCLAHHEGKPVFVWGGLPGELVDVRVTKKRSSYLEGVAELVHKPSKERIESKEPLSYLSTSPWQIMTFEAENQYKQAILEETFEHEGVQGIQWDDLYSSLKEYGYRNKMELGFWGDDEGLHLAHYVRGTHGKQKVEGSALAMDCINDAARAVRDELNRLGVWGGDLKTILLRANQQKEVVGALFIKKELDMADFKLPKELKGLDIYYSEPKSPASVPTKKLYSLGDIKLVDTVLGQNIMYDVLSFFQVNLQVFEEAAGRIKEIVEGQRAVDMYSGVGTIGISVGATTLVESDETNIAMAEQNTVGTDIKVVHATSETALEHITSDTILILDPPRAGLHKDVIKQIAEVGPLQVIYLSCNPVTQARDVKMLSSCYSVTEARGYNFFPRTPHIESLIVLELK